MFVFVSFCLYECLTSISIEREGGAKVICVSSFYFFRRWIFVICIFHHSLGLSICGARCFLLRTRCVRTIYRRDVIGWSATASCSLCPYDVRGGDDHRSLFYDGHPCDWCHIRLVYDSMLFVFLRHCLYFQFYALLDFLLLVIDVVVLCVFCDSVLSFYMCPMFE